MHSGIQIRSKGVINSIANKAGKIKGKKNNYRFMKDFLILLQRPWTLGRAGTELWSGDRWRAKVGPTLHRP